MPTLGSGIASAGEDIGRGIAFQMQQYHKEHVAYDEAYGIAEALSRIGVDQQGRVVQIQPDAQGKVDKSLTPAIDPKALERFKTFNRQNAAEARGALNALSGIGRLYIQGAIRQSVGESGLAGQLKQARIEQSQARTTLTNTQTAQALGLLPPKVNAPTGGQIMANQRAQWKDLESQRTKIENVFSKYTPAIPDPNALLDQSQWTYGTKGTKGGLDVPVVGKVGGQQNVFLPTANNTEKGATHIQIPGVARPLPIDQARSLQKRAQEWQKLGTDVETLKNQQKVFSQLWNLLTPQQQAAKAGLLLSNPTPQMKAFFDQKFGAGAADTVINAQSKVAPNSTPQPSTEESAEDIDTSGEEENGE